MANLISQNWQTVQSYFEGKGWTPAQAQGITAALASESQLDPNAINPSSNATGLAQWLGSRLNGMIGAGGSGNLMSQLEYVQQELTTPGLDAGALRAGNSIVGMSNPSSIASTFINSFERPGPQGAAGDLGRANSYLGTFAANRLVTMAAARPPWAIA